MPTQQPGYYRDLLDQILEAAAPSKPNRQELIKRQVLQKLRRVQSSGSKIPHWLKYMTNELWDVPHGQPPNQELVEYGVSTEFNLLFPINDKENNIKEIVLRIYVDENGFRVFG